MIRKITTAIAGIAMLLSLGATPVFAARSVTTTDAGTGPIAALPESVPMPSGLSNCFDYYSFGSVQVSVTPALAQVAQGAVITFSGTVTNMNPYPVVDATVWVKIFRDRTGGVKDVNGPDVVGMFPAAEHLTLVASSSVPIAFGWRVPYSADPGSYKAAMYVTASSRFELSGLIFTDDVTGSMEPFTVIGNTKGDTRFDKSGVTVNGAPFYFAAYPPIVGKTVQSVPVTARIANTSDTSYLGTLRWDLYYWDALQGSHLLTSSTSKVNIASHATTTVLYSVDDTAHAVYYLLGTLSDAKGGARSLIGIRFVRSSVAEPRLNDLGVSRYPLSGDSTAFVCFHSTSTTFPQHARVELSVTPVGFIAGLFGPIAETSYAGTIPGDIYALTMPLPAGATSFNLTAKLYSDDGKLVDSVTIPYRCSALGAPCSYTDTIAALIFIAFIFVVAVALAARVRRLGRRAPDQQVTTSL